MALDPSLLAWLRCFDAAARNLSFTRAAQELRISQGAVSQQIKSLEARLRCRLFVRASGALELTPAGQRFAAEISPAFQAIEGAVRSLRATAIPLHVSCSPSFAHRWLLPRLSEFVRNNPRIDLRLRAEFHSLDRKGFLRDGIDIAIRYDPFEHPDVRMEALMDDYLYPVASPDLLAELRASSRSARERFHTLLQDAAPWEGAKEDDERKALEKGGNWIWTEPVSSRYFNLSDLALGAALRSEGVAVGRISLIADELADGRLVPLASTPAKAPARYVMLTVNNSDVRIEKFRAWLLGKCGQFIVQRSGLMAAAGRSGE